MFRLAKRPQCPVGRQAALDIPPSCNSMGDCALSPA
jgi:hypothetical protein